jgi:CRP-like cAMP-binding protein
MLGPGHTIGALETLAERPYRATIDAATPVRALESSANAIFDVLEDHTDLGMAMLASFAATLSAARA